MLHVTGDRDATEINDDVPTRAAGGLFSPGEREQFARDGYIIVRQLAGPVTRERMLEVAREGLAREIAPLEYEADLHYPGAPASRDAEGGRTVRRLKQALRAIFVSPNGSPRPRLPAGCSSSWDQRS